MLLLVTSENLLYLLYPLLAGFAINAINAIVAGKAETGEYRHGLSSAEFVALPNVTSFFQVQE